MSKISTVDGLLEKDEQEQHLVNRVKEEHQENESPTFSIRFQVLATALVMFCALSGSMLGAIFSETQANKDLISWIALPGDLFIRALKCIVLPLVFVNVVLAMIQMGEAGKAATVGLYTVGVYTCTTLIAAMEGLILVIIFQSQFTKKEAEIDPTFIRFLCPLDGFTLVQSGSDVLCKNASEIDFESSEANFEITDLNSFFESNVETFEPVTFSQTLQDNVFKQLIIENVFLEFAGGGFVGIVMFAVLLGAASQSMRQKPVLIVEMFEDLNDVFIRMINWIIVFTPIAVFSLITGALAVQEDLPGTLSDIGILLMVMIIGDILHLFIVYPSLFFILTRHNPFMYMKFLLPAQMFSFACASSAATLPVSMRCVKASGQVPDSVRDFVLPIGATLNMDGAALFFPPALIFLATQAGLEAGFAEYFLIIIVSTIGSAGTAPVPNAGVLLLLVAYNTVFGGDVPENFGILVGIQFLVDRCQVVVNITGDCMAARIVTHLAKVEVTPDRPTSMLSVEKERN